MQIGIYKPFKKVLFHDDAADNAAWSYEVVHVAKTLAKAGNEVFILSETDLQNGVFPGIQTGDLSKQYDRIILWSGSFSLDEKGDSIIKELAEHTARLDFMLTDLRLVPSDKSYYQYFANIYTQATRPIEGIGGIYGGVAEFLPYDHVYTLSLEESIAQKRVDYYFGGTERGRLDDFLEYVWRPEALITTKSAFLGIENRVDRHQYMKLLDATKYSIVIADVEYNDNYFITPRPYEYFIHDIVCFTDNKFDRDGHIIPLDSWLRVNSFKELKEKINFLENNPLEYRKWLEWGRSQITNELTDGSYVLSKIQ